ncbi:hypothetical protein LV779_00745 [Streptomyces thinghirensis]|nr:hypothetical protein [Streptomyces thinghirensis]
MSGPRRARRHQQDGSRRAVVTGLGVVSPHGIGVEAFWKAVADGKLAVSVLSPREGCEDMPLRVAGEVARLRRAAETAEGRYLCPDRPLHVLRPDRHPAGFSTTRVSAAPTSSRRSRSAWPLAARVGRRRVRAAGAAEPVGPGVQVCRPVPVDRLAPTRPAPARSPSATTSRAPCGSWPRRGGRPGRLGARRAVRARNGTDTVVCERRRRRSPRTRSSGQLGAPGVELGHRSRSRLPPVHRRGLRVRAGRGRRRTRGGGGGGGPGPPRGGARRWPGTRRPSPARPAGRSPGRGWPTRSRARWPRPAAGPEEVDVVSADALGVPEADRAEALALADGSNRTRGACRSPRLKTGTGRAYRAAPVLDVATAVLAMEHGLDPGPPRTWSTCCHDLDAVVGRASPRRAAHGPDPRPRPHGLQLGARPAAGATSCAVRGPMTDPDQRRPRPSAASGASAYLSQGGHPMTDQLDYQVTVEELAALMKRTAGVQCRPGHPPAAGRRRLRHLRPGLPRPAGHRGRCWRSGTGWV